MSIRESMRSPASEIHTPVSEAIAPGTPTDVESYDIVVMRRELDKAKKDCRDLSQKISNKNAHYLLEEQRLSEAIQESAEATGASVPGSDLGSAGARSRQRAFRMQDEEEATAKAKRLKDLEKEIADVQQKIIVKQSEEELSGIAVSRLKDRTSILELESAKVNANIDTALDAVNDAQQLSYHHRLALGKELSLNIRPLPTIIRDDHTKTVEHELIPLSLRMSQATKSLISQIQELGAGITEEAELQAAVFKHVEAAHLGNKGQLEDQSELLVDAQKALNTLQEKVASLDQELGDLHKQRAQVEADMQKEGTLESLAERQAQLSQQVSSMEREATDSKRRRDEARTARDQAARQRKEALERLSDDQVHLKNSQQMLSTVERQKADAENEKSHLERSIRATNESIHNLELERQRLRDEIASAEEEKISVVDRQRKLEGEQDRAAAEVRTAKKDHEAKTDMQGRKEKWLEDLKSELEQYKTKNADLMTEKALLKQDQQISQMEAETATAAAERASDQLTYARSLLPKSHPAVTGNLRDIRSRHARDKAERDREASGSQNSSLLPEIGRVSPENIRPSQAAPTNHANLTRESTAALRSMLHSSSGGPPVTPPSQPVGDEYGRAPAVAPLAPVSLPPPQPTGHKGLRGSEQQEVVPKSSSKRTSRHPTPTADSQFVPANSVPANFEAGMASQRSLSDVSQSTGASGNMSQIQDKLKDILNRKHEREGLQH